MSGINGEARDALAAALQAELEREQFAGPDDDESSAIERMATRLAARGVRLAAPPAEAESPAVMLLQQWMRAAPEQPTGSLYDLMAATESYLAGAMPPAGLRAWIAALPNDACRQVVNAYRDEWDAVQTEGKASNAMRCYEMAARAFRGALLSLAPKEEGAP